MPKNNLPKGSKMFSVSFDDQSVLQMLYLFRTLQEIQYNAIEERINGWKMNLYQRFSINPAEMAVDLSKVFDPKKPEVTFFPRPQEEPPAPVSESVEG